MHKTQDFWTFLKTDICVFVNELFKHLGFLKYFFISKTVQNVRTVDVYLSTVLDVPMIKQVNFCSYKPVWRRSLNLMTLDTCLPWVCSLTYDRCAGAVRVWGEHKHQRYPQHIWFPFSAATSAHRGIRLFWNTLCFFACRSMVDLSAVPTVVPDGKIPRYLVISVLSRPS